MQSREFVDLGARAVDVMARLKMAAGIALIAAAVLVAVFPQILVILLASLMASAGIGTLVSGWRMRRRLTVLRDARPAARVHEYVVR